MSPPPVVSPSTLTDKELEILRLLAGGHTVKSIAARLERSEASINERLREARRKTGVGSSRELARLIAKQKIWDEKIDLSQRATSSEDQDRPPQGRVLWTKGQMMMLIAISLAGAGLLVTATNPLERSESAHPATLVAAAPSPLVGRWSLDVAQIPEAERPRAVTIAFSEASGGRWNTVVEIVAPDGSQMEARSTATLDGVAVPVAGSMGFLDSISLRQPESGTLVMTLSKDGQRVSTRVYTVAKDGKSMSETIVWAAEGMPDIVTTTFTRMS